jgi:hypothetical protein
VREPAAPKPARKDPPAPPDPPPRRRRLLIYGLLSVLISGSVIAMVRDDPYGKELWPFSAYPMYSVRLRGWAARPHRVFGVLRDDPAREIPLIASEYLHPIEHSRFYIALRTLEQDRSPGGALDATLRDTLARYESRRKAGLHGGPALRGLRLYELYYRLDRRASNRDRPDGRLLLFEVASP